MVAKITTPKNGLTDAFIKHLKAPDERYEIADKKTTGLRVRVGTTGKKTFVWVYKDQQTKKMKRLTLGRYGNGEDQLTLSSARKALEQAKIKHEAGELNNTMANTPKTVSELCTVFYEKRIVPHLRRPDAVKQVIDHDIIPVIGAKNISTISTVTLTKCIDIVVDRGAVSHAGKVTAILKQLFKFAEGKGYIDRSPAYSLDKKDLGIISNQRERWLTSDEIKIAWDGINGAPKMSLPVKNGLKVLMLTGVRSGELIKAKWENIDFDKKEWFIPKHDTKTLQEWTIPLTHEVIKLMAELQGLDSVYVFCGTKGILSDKALGRAMRRLFEQGILAIDPLRPHDFRRTIRTHLEVLNIPPHIAEKCLNHSLGAINATYNKNTYIDERREALEKWSAFVYRQVDPQDNIINFKKVG